MELGNIIIIVAIVLVVLIFALFPEARSLFKGFTRLFIKDMATTPKEQKLFTVRRLNRHRMLIIKQTMHIRLLPVN